MRSLLVSTGKTRGDDTFSEHIGPFPDMAAAIVELLGTSGDCNSNAIPDRCEEGARDCNNNLVPDAIEIGCDPALDCHNNDLTLDECQALFPKGACCLPAGCVDAFLACRCIAGGGTYAGDGSKCSTPFQCLQFGPHPGP